MSKLFDVVAAVGKYTDAGGNEKTRWVNVGSMFEGRDGRGPSIKLDAVPAGEWNGWLSCFAPKDRQERQSEDRRPEFDDNIPF